MSVTLSLFAGAGAQFLDNNGNPLNGGKIYTYYAGTTTPLTTYTTNSGTVAHTNPIVLDAAGRVPSGGEIWLTLGIGYKFVVKTSTEVLIATYDNIPSSAQPPAANDADSIMYEQGYTVTAGNFVIGEMYRIATLGTTDFMLIGAVNNVVGTHFIATGAGSGTGTAEFSRTVESKLRETVSVMDFGAVGDGVTDDTAAIQAAIDAADKINFPAGHFIITEPLIVPPQKELIGTGGTGKVNWQSNFADLAGQTVINKTTNTPDAQFGLDALLICSNGNPSPVAAETGSQVYPAGGDVFISNLCFIGNGVHGPGGSGSHNAFGIVAGSGQHTHIANVFMRRTGVSLYMHGTYLSSVDHFGTFGQIYQYTGTSTTYTGCEAGYGLYGGFRLSSVSYSTLQNCAVDAPLYSAYTLKDCKGVSLVSCGQEFIREDPLPASTRGMYLNFEGGNSVSVIAHRAFDNNPPISNPGYETSLISATTGDNISFVSDYIIIPLFPTITGLKYARLMNDARVEVSGGYGYLSDTFSGNFNIASTARYTIFDADATLVQMKGQLPSTQLPNTNGRGALWAVDSYQADTDLAVTIGGSSTGITYAWRKCSITRVNNKILVSMLIYMTATGGLTGTVKITGFPWEPPATYYSRAFTFVLFNPATAQPRIAYGTVGAGGVIDLFDSTGAALTQTIFPPAPVFTQFDAQFIIEIDPSTGP